jgi:hypothetical protein
MSATDVPLTSTATQDMVQTAAGGQQRVAINRDQDDGGAKLLFTDARVAFLLLDEARYRALARLFGVPRDKSFLVTTIALGTLAQALHDKAAGVLTVQAARRSATPQSRPRC